MKADCFYSCAAGRMLFQGIQRLGGFKLAAGFLRSSISRPMIARYIRNNNIDMHDFAGQEYASFAEFFSRRRSTEHYVLDPEVLISPCDGLLCAYSIGADTEIQIKGSVYRISDLLPDGKVAAQFAGGLALVFRLQAADYHRFCSFDDCLLRETHYISGQLHSVQPIACRSVPVYRLNRRWWSVLESNSFGTVAQIEVGAMMVGGVRFVREQGWLTRGEEMGAFQLAGSTIVLLFRADVRRSLKLFPAFLPCFDGETEVRVRMGDGIGRRST